MSTKKDVDKTTPAAKDARMCRERNAMNSPETQSRHSVQRMVRAIRDLLDHPFPHDLMKLRRRVAGEYGGDEAAAKSEMAEWCSQELCDCQLDAYIEARKAGNAIIAEYGPNEKLTALPDDQRNPPTT